MDVVEVYDVVGFAVLVVTMIEDAINEVDDVADDV